MNARQIGFTLLELVTVIGIISVLGAIALVAYDQYVSRSRASDILVKYDALRSGVGAELAQGMTAQCADLAARLGTANLKDEYAELGIGFEAVVGGYRPVMTVCSKTDAHGARGVKVAHAAHDTIRNTSRVEKNAVLTDTLVSFAAPLTDFTRPACASVVTMPQVQSSCGARGLVCPPDQEPITLSGRQVCVPKCPAGQVRPTSGNPILCVPAPAKPAGTATPANTQPAGPVLGSTSPSAPKLPAPTGIAIRYGTQTSVQRPDAYWLSQIRATSPDGSPVRIVSLSMDPAFGTVIGSPGNWGFQFARPGVSGDTVITVTLQNGAGTTTGQFRLATGH